MPQNTSYHQQPQPQSNIPPNPATYARRPNDYRDPPPIEVYTLPDHANLSIPLEVREQYQRDEFGRVLFFTTPPVPSVTESDSTASGHSVRYLAARARREEMLAQRRKEREMERQAGERVAKKAKLEKDEQARGEIEKMKVRALGVLESQLAASVQGVLEDKELGTLSQAQKGMEERERRLRESEEKRTERRKVGMESKVFGDDWDSRIL